MSHDGQPFAELSSVVAVVDRGPVRRGQRGTVVAVYGAGVAYEVEFPGGVVETMEPHELTTPEVWAS